MVDTPIDEFELRRIPVRFRNVPDYFLRQECCIPTNAPTLKTFWDNLPEKASYVEIDRLINETLKDWKYLPVTWKSKFSRVELQAFNKHELGLPPRDDQLIVVLDDVDSRKKAFYAPFEAYDPYKNYGNDDLKSLY